MSGRSLSKIPENLPGAVGAVDEFTSAFSARSAVKSLHGAIIRIQPGDESPTRDKPVTWTVATIMARCGSLDVEPPAQLSS